MKRLILLVFIVNGCHSDIPSDGYAEDVHRFDHYKIDYGAKKDYNKVHDEYGFRVPGTENDDKNDNADIDLNQELREEKFRPCVLDDLDCMRKFLAANSNCEVQHGPRPDPLIVPVDKMFFPYVNLTVTHVNLHVEGFKSANITEFYVNKYTGNLVIAIKLRKFSQTAPKSYFTYQRTAKEPIVLSDFSTVTYDSFIYTVIIPKVPHLKLEHAEIHADVPDSTPYYVIGPKAYTSTDPEVISAYATFTANIPFMIREAYVFQSYLMAGVFIEKTLCDFGVDVYKNYLHFIKTKAFTNVPGYLLNQAVKNY